MEKINFAERFLFNWYSFPIDYWWRKKYNVPFGSRAHREMNFIDMVIEFEEDLQMMKANVKEDDTTDRDLGLDYKDENSVQLTQGEIDEDYENLELDEFN